MKQLFYNYGSIGAALNKFELNELLINEEQNHPLNKKK